MTEELVRIELYLPVELAERVDITIERRGGRSPVQTKEHFLLAALLWALASIEEDDRASEMALDI